MGRGHEKTFLQRKYRDDQQEYEKMLNITNNKGKASQNHHNIYLRPVKMAIIKMFKKVNTHTHTKTNGNDVKKRDPLCTVRENVTWYSLMEKSIEVPQNLKTELLFDTAIPLLSTHPKEIKSLS